MFSFSQLLFPNSQLQIKTKRTWKVVMNFQNMHVPEIPNSQLCAILTRIDATPVSARHVKRSTTNRPVSSQIPSSKNIPVCGKIKSATLVALLLQIHNPRTFTVSLTERINLFVSTDLTNQQNFNANQHFLIIAVGKITNVPQNQNPN